MKCGAQVGVEGVKCEVWSRECEVWSVMWKV